MLFTFVCCHHLLTFLEVYYKSQNKIQSGNNKKKSSKQYNKWQEWCFGSILVFYEMYENIDHCPGNNQTHGLETRICTELLKITCI